MKKVFVKPSEDNLNKIERFVEEICDGLNINDTFFGNMLIAITEMVNLFEQHQTEAEIEFLTEEKELNFVFGKISSERIDALYKIFNTPVEKIENEFADSVFMITALCDDVVCKKESNQIVLSFLNTGLDNEISAHRKNYLSNYLSQQIKVK